MIPKFIVDTKGCCAALRKLLHARPLHPTQTDKETGLSYSATYPQNIGDNFVCHVQVLKNIYAIYIYIIYII